MELMVRVRGYTGTENTFNTDLADVSNKAPLTIIREYNNGVLVAKVGQDTGALVNANGSFDIVSVTWNGNTPTASPYPTATFGFESTIGFQDAAHLDLEYNHFRMVDSMGYEYVKFDELRNKSGRQMGPISETYRAGDVAHWTPLDDLEDELDLGLGGTTSSTRQQYDFPTTLPPLPQTGAIAYGEITVKVNDVIVTPDSITMMAGYNPQTYYWYNYETLHQEHITLFSLGLSVTFSNALNDDDIVELTYYTISPYAKAFTLGHRQGSTGALSLVAGGFDNEASGFASLAAGYCAKAIGKSQTALGKFNKADYDSAFLIGNGKDGNNRSNALMVDWHGNLMTQGMAGMIQMYAGATIPTGWLLCDGSEYDITAYSELNDALGGNSANSVAATLWGTAASGKFKVPDLRGRAPIGAGTGTGLTARTLGTQNIGSETHALTAAQTGIRNHTHTYSDYNTTYTLKTTNRKPGTSTAVAYGTGLTAGGGATTRTSNNPASEQSGAAHPNMQPSAVVNFIIATGKTY